MVPQYFAQANFWHAFYRNLLPRGRDNQSEGIRSCFVDDYLDRHGASGEVKVRPGAWNTGWHDGSGFTQWISSSTPQLTLTRLGRDQPGHLRARRNVIGILVRDRDMYLLLEQAHRRVLRAETGRATPAAALPRRSRPGHRLPGSGSGAYYLILPAYALPVN